MRKVCILLYIETYGWLYKIKLVYNVELVEDADVIELGHYCSSSSSSWESK